MGITVKTLGCNGLCRDCYENRIRSVMIHNSCDVEAIVKTIRTEVDKIPKAWRTNTVCLHGGEPLLLKYDDLEKMLNVVFELYGHTNIQTNGILINDKMIKLFKKYNTSIGLSIDGDTADLNWGRWNAVDMSREKIQEMTDKVIDNMKRSIDAGLSVSLISLLRRCNASKEKLDDFIRFLFRMYSEFGIAWIRTNKAIVYEDKHKQDELAPVELGDALVKISDVCLTNENLYWLPYRDVVDLMLGYADATCTFTECDVWHTESERAILYDGSIGNCLQSGSAIDGIQSLSHPLITRERYCALEQIPQEFGGCKDCHFWFCCKGGCPGEGLDNDWRSRTRFCESWKMLFSHIQKKIKAIFPNILTVPEFYPNCPSAEMVQTSLGIGGSAWQVAKRKKVNEVTSKLPEQSVSGCHGDSPHGNSHYDSHGDSGHGDSGHGDVDHGDIPHGDADHGDSGHGDIPHGDA